MKVALVTGASSGIGYTTCLALAKEGYTTYATMRDTLKVEFKDPIKKIQLDVDKQESVESAISQIIKESGKIDVLVNNAGYGVFGATEDVTIKEYKAQFETNFFGVIRMIQGVAPHMRKQSSGYIVNISSVAGRVGFPARRHISGSKFALEGLSESLRYEMDPYGIKVVIIEPGVIKTNFFKDAKIATKPDSPFKESIEKFMEGIKMMVEMGTDPSQVSDVIIQAIKEENPDPRYVVGNDAIMFLEARKAKTDVEFENYLKTELFSH